MNNSITARFSASASTYNRHSSLQESIAKELVEFIPADTDGSAILEIGCGTGFLTEKLFTKFPKANALVLDISDAMLTVAKERLKSFENIEWLQKDLNQLEVDKEFTLSVSSSSFHWIQPLTLAFSKVAKHSSSNAKLVFAMMTSNTFRELNEARRKITPQKGSGTTLPHTDEVINALEVNGFKISLQKVKTYKTSHASCKEFFKTIHEQGVTGQNKKPSILSRSELTNLMNYYDKTFKDKDGSVFATYEVLFVTAELGKVRG